MSISSNCTGQHCPSNQTFKRLGCCRHGLPHYGRTSSLMSFEAGIIVRSFLQCQAARDAHGPWLASYGSHSSSIISTGKSCFPYCLFSVATSAFLTRSSDCQEPFLLGCTASPCR